ncbi:4'-phosphopantetheinyl transferase superfamily protein [Streptomyces sp. NPDC014983]|uniref:4'-phosphopantetheinyl transferase superfamily protein n=1 Tax=Streptomyces sp. NPDC014983 TaxID=3364933 RepID=UPI003703107E
MALPDERRHLARPARSRPQVVWERVLFSAKEGVCKAWFPLAGRRLGFPDCAVAPDPDSGTFAAALRVPGPVVAGARVDRFTGRRRVLEGRGHGLVGTAVAVRGHV